VLIIYHRFSVPEDAQPKATLRAIHEQAIFVKYRQIRGRGDAFVICTTSESTGLSAHSLVTNTQPGHLHIHCKRPEGSCYTFLLTGDGTWRDLTEDYWEVKRIASCRIAHPQHPQLFLSTTSNMAPQWVTAATISRHETEQKSRPDSEAVQRTSGMNTRRVQVSRLAGRGDVTSG